jgi:gamma-glutamylcyclotransferase (GGCT)/AIG2-like uncharacterized protein YtfP
VNRPRNSSGTFLLFVYGTLKRGGRRHGLLARQLSRGQARTRPLYALHHLGAYPGLVAAVGAGQVVRGELYEIDCALLRRLDRVEGAPGLFDLGPVELDDEVGPAWAYFYQRDPAGPRIESGVWEITEERR